MRKFLFLDIDGVLFTLGGCIYHRLQKEERMPDKELDPVCLALLSRFLKDHENVSVVISSTWRRTHTLEELKEALGEIIGSRIVGITPSLGGYRGREIHAWLKDNAPEARADDVLILDDDSDMNPFMGCLFLTDAHNGFTAKDWCHLNDYMKASAFSKKKTRIKKALGFKLNHLKWAILRPLRLRWWRLQQHLKKLSQKKTP